MKKLFTLAMVLFFLTATSGLVLAQGSTSPAPAKTTMKKEHKKKKHSKKKAEKKEDKTSTAPATK